MFRTFLFLSIAVLLFAQSGSGQQPFPPGGHPGMGPERLEKYKKLRLIEALDLKEEDAVRFMAKYTTHENNLHDLMKQRMELIDQLELLLRTQASDKEFQKLFTQLEENEQKMFNERKRFQNEIKSSLTTEQAAKFLVFDRNFNRELHEAMQEMRRERHMR